MDGGLGVMALLDNFPHLCTAKRRTRTSDARAGTVDSYSTILFTARKAWKQFATQRQILEFDKRGISITDVVYFLQDPEVDEKDILVVTDQLDTVVTYEVRSKGRPDSLGDRVWKVFCEETTTGSTP